VIRGHVEVSGLYRKKDVSQGGVIISSAVDDHVECISSTAPTINHPPTGAINGI